MDSALQHLNQQFAIPGQLAFEAGPGGFLMAVINNAHASATMTLAGGHVMSYAPTGQHPVLWVSPNASWTLGQAMRGGVPVCWPWFALHPTDPRGKPLHGLVRTMLWEVKSTRALPDGSTEVVMETSNTPETLAIWPHAFALEVTATFGPRLRVAWSARNTGAEPFEYTGALHPYYAVSDIADIRIHGLDGTDYLDKNDALKRKTQHGPLRITEPIDAIFLDTTAELVVEDPGLRRKLHIAKRGSHTSVVWNPYEKDAQMPDVGAGQHQHFFCAEAANAAQDTVTVAPGEAGHLMMEIWVEEMDA